MSVQKPRDGREIRLRNTRWCCQHDSIVAILSTFPAVLETLQGISDGADRSSAIEARGIHSGLKDLHFVVCLTIYKRVFSITARLSDVLQAESLYIGSATHIFQATIDTFEKMRSDLQWDLLWQEATALAAHTGCNEDHSKPRRQRQTPTTLQDYSLTGDTAVGSTPITTSLSDGYKIDVYYSTLDCILQEIIIALVM